MASLKELSRKRKLKNAAANKAKAAADAAAAADATAVATTASAAAATATDAASCAAAATIAPAAPAGSGSAAASIRVFTCQSYAAAVVNGPAVAVNVAAETTSVVAASVASPSSAATKLSKKIKLSAAVASPAAMANVTGNAFLPHSAQDLHTTTLKSPKKRDKIAAAVGHGATTDASVPASKSRYPSRRNAGIITINVVGASSHPLAKDADADPIVPANLASLAVKKSSFSIGREFSLNILGSNQKKEADLPLGNVKG
jgi:hypothetical protein